MARVRFVAEVSSNHHTDLERCLAFVDRAADIGCDAVKFQLFRMDQLFAPEILGARPELQARRAWELPEEMIPAIAERARSRRLELGCTPFFLEAVDVLEPHVDFFKIASYELMWDDLLRACARTGKPVVLSTGMADFREVGHALSVLCSAGCRDLTLLACISGYPTPAERANLAAIESLRALGARYAGMRVASGWSDHTVQPGVIHRAVHRFDARMVEFHLDLEGEGAEYAAGHCWLPGTIAEVIRNVRIGQCADGSGAIAPSTIEEREREWRADPRDGLRPLVETRLREGREGRDGREGLVQ